MSEIERISKTVKLQKSLLDLWEICEKSHDLPSLSTLLSEAMNKILDERIVPEFYDHLIYEKQLDIIRLEEEKKQALHIKELQQSKLKVITLAQKQEESRNEFRMTKFEKNKSSLITQYKNHCIDWKKIKDVFEFETTAKAEATITEWFRQENLI